MRFILICVLFSFIGCTHTQPPVATTASPRKPASRYPDCIENPRLNEECEAPNEEEEHYKLNSRVREIVKAVQVNRGVQYTEKPMRGFHAKAHGCLLGELEVAPGRPKQFGIFANTSNANKTYPVWVRYSNGMGFYYPDSLPDFRGMAIKVMNVEGERLTPVSKVGNPSPEFLQKRISREKSQDFPLISSPTAFLKDAKGAVDMMEALSHIPRLSSAVNPLNYFNLLHFMYLHSDVLKETPSLIGFLNDPLRSLMEHPYYSAVPLLVGGQAAKLKATPCPENYSMLKEVVQDITFSKLAPHYLKADLVDRAKKWDMCFKIEAQYQENPKTEPIEDGGPVWTTPFHELAILRFHPKDNDNVGDPDRMHFCDSLHYSPWDGIADHRPLGEAQRARRGIYEVSQEERGAKNDYNRNSYYDDYIEPNGTEKFNQKAESFY